MPVFRGVSVSITIDNQPLKEYGSTIHLGSKIHRLIEASNGDVFKVNYKIPAGFFQGKDFNILLFVVYVNGKRVNNEVTTPNNEQIEGVIAGRLIEKDDESLKEDLMLQPILIDNTTWVGEGELEEVKEKAGQLGLIRVDVVKGLWLEQTSSDDSEADESCSSSSSEEDDSGLSIAVPGEAAEGVQGTHRVTFGRVRIRDERQTRNVEDDGSGDPWLTFTFRAQSKAVLAHQGLTAPRLDSVARSSKRRLDDSLIDAETLLTKKPRPGPQQEGVRKPEEPSTGAEAGRIVLAFRPKP